MTKSKRELCLQVSPRIATPIQMTVRELMRPPGRPFGRSPTRTTHPHLSHCVCAPQPALLQMTWLIMLERYYAYLVIVIV